MVTLSIIVPTIGRRILRKLLREVIPQLNPGDEVLVIADGPQPYARRIVTGIHPQVHYHETEQTRCWGHPQRNWAIQIAKASHVVSFDDDDALLPNSLAAIRTNALATPDRPMIFRMKHRSLTLWFTPELVCGNVSTQMFVVPNNRLRLGTWGNRYEGDLDFITSTAQLYPSKEKAIIWKEDVIALHGIAGRDPRGSMSAIDRLQ